MISVIAIWISVMIICHATQIRCASSVLILNLAEAREAKLKSSLRIAHQHWFVHLSLSLYHLVNMYVPQCTYSQACSPVCDGTHVLQAPISLYSMPLRGPCHNHPHCHLRCRLHHLHVVAIRIIIVIFITITMFKTLSMHQGRQQSSLIGIITSPLSTMEL